MAPPSVWSLPLCSQTESTLLDLTEEPRHDAVADKRHVERAIATLHDVIAVRDSGQHSAAGSRGAAALADLGIGFPPPSWAFAWTVVSARTIEALEALREELATLTE